MANRLCAICFVSHRFLMIIAINDNLIPRVFQTIEGYKYWCERQVEKGMSPDELIGNQVHQVNEGEEANEDNWVDVHEFHCGLYSNGG